MTTTNIIIGVLGILAVSLLGALTDRLLTNFLPPDKSEQRHTIAIILVILVLAVGYAVITQETNNGTVTREQIQIWTTGETDKDTVYDVIYNQIHIISGKRPFTVGDTLPKGVLITTDLGNSWQNFPVREIVRNGGWGVFETLDSFKSPATGEYWLIAP